MGVLCNHLAKYTRSAILHLRPAAVSRALFKTTPSHRTTRARPREIVPAPSTGPLEHPNCSIDSSLPMFVHWVCEPKHCDHTLWAIAVACAALYYLKRNAQSAGLDFAEYFSR